jgi:hypothetical protein
MAALYRYEGKWGKRIPKNLIRMYALYIVDRGCTVTSYLGYLLGFISLSKALNNPWEFSTCTATQGFNTLWDAKVHYRVNNSPPFVLILSHTNEIYTAPSCRLKFWLLTFHVPNLIRIFFVFCRLSQESAQVIDPLWYFATIFLRWIVVSPNQNHNTPSWRTTPCGLSVAAYSMYSQLPITPRGHPMSHAVMTRDQPNTGVQWLESRNHCPMLSVMKRFAFRLEL